MQQIKKIQDLSNLFTPNWNMRVQMNEDNFYYDIRPNCEELKHGNVSLTRLVTMRP